MTDFIKEESQPVAFEPSYSLAPYDCPLTLDGVDSVYCESFGRGAGCRLLKTCRPYNKYKEEKKCLI